MRHFEITLADMMFHARHGVMAQETAVGNEFSVSLTVRLPFYESVDSDCLDDTVSYADLHGIVAREMKTPRKLLETVASAIADGILRQWPQVEGGHITICKTVPPIAANTGKASVTLFF